MEDVEDDKGVSLRGKGERSRRWGRVIKGSTMPKRSALEDPMLGRTIKKISTPKRIIGKRVVTHLSITD